MQADLEQLADFTAEANEQLALLAGDLPALRCPGARVPAELGKRLSMVLLNIESGARLLELAHIRNFAHELGGQVSQAVQGEIPADTLAQGLAQLELLVQHPEDNSIADGSAGAPVSAPAAAAPLAAGGSSSSAPAAVPPPATPASVPGAAQTKGWGADPELLEEFVADAHEHLSTVEEDLLTIERQGAQSSGDVVNHLFRSLHTVKGGATLLGFAHITQLAHALENIVGLVRSGELAVDRPLVDVLLRGTDTLQRLLQHPQDTTIDIRGDLAAAEAVRSGSVADRTASASDSQTAGPAQSAPVANPPGDTAEIGTPAAAPSTGDEKAAGGLAGGDAHGEAAGDQTVRISLGLLDRLMNLASELVLVRNQNVQAAESQDLEQLTTISQRLNVVTSELQATVMQTRMRPIGSVFTKFNRMIRDLARKLGKEVELEIVGSEVELDKSIVEAIGDPLTHLVRNAVDHGLEPPAVRQQLDKPPAGRISLRAFHQDGQVFVQIQDDGQGLDPVVLKRVAVERGVLRADEAESLSGREALALIFRPGFSTSTQVTDVSGRGVGMDVVKTVLRRLGGTVDLSSHVGLGTTVTIKLPLTLAIVPTLIVAVGEQYFALPQVNIDEVVWLHGTAGEQAIKRVTDHEVYWLRGKLLPIVRLGKILSLAAASTSRQVGSSASKDPAAAGPALPDTAYIVVVRQGHEQFGLVVDKLIDTQEIVVKPLHEQLKDSRAFSGTTVLGDGRIALILDIAAVAEIGRLKFIKSEPQVGPNKSSLRDEQMVLLFDIGSAERFFIPLCLITRVEEIRPAQIQVANQREYLSFRGELIPLARIEQTLPQITPQYPADRLFVIVPKCRRPFGIVASRILDTAQMPQEIDSETVKLPGVSGSQLVNGQMLLFLNPFRAIETIEPGWLAEEFSKVRGLQRVLIIDDSPFAQVVLCSYLHGAEVTPVLAANGREALAALSHGSYDLIISDLEMPIMDGFEFARAVRRHPVYRHLPLLAVSGAGEEMRAPALEAGFDHFRSKFDRPGFLESVAALGRRSADGGPGGAS